jgi:hypothetical protein
MQTNPNIILSGNQMAAPQLPDVNAMMQTRTAGLENIYGVERQRAEDARLEQERQDAAAAEAMLPSVMAAYKDPSDAGLDQAVSLLPAEVRDTFAPFIARLKAIPDPATRRAILESELAKDAAGRTVLDRVMTPYQEGSLGVQQAQLAQSRRRLEFEQAEAGRPPQMTPYQEAQLALEREKLAAGGSSADYTTVETAQGIFLLNKRTGELIPATAGEGPIEAGAPPQALQPKPTPEKAEETKKRLSDEKRAKDLALVVEEIETIMEPGGLIDQATGSYIGNLVDTAAAVFGAGTTGSEAIAALAPISDLVLKMVPRFEGPQSNYDVQSYKEAAGNLSNPNVPGSVKMRAAKEIKRLFEKYQGQFEYNPAGAGGGVIDFNDLGG